MGVYRPLVIFAIVVAIAPVISFATEIVVGDEAGWKLNFDYQNWASGKKFTVGDTLVFKYKQGDHNVYKVNGTDFQNCNVPKNNSLGLFTGNDTIKLAAAGDKWYICGVGDHCSQGMRLKISVSNSAPALYAKVPIFQIFSGIIFAMVAMITVN
ncbi:Plastocyanin-like protein [Corchorus capsularis]|uniref:Plastocyanin-like protein n=1 Tax=Corchorus capsularis TaxID=210143 RepID=A0A1R3HC34_COCAP|nr:Plastocyanin-like protein [Corchorus capsularis]